MHSSSCTNESADTAEGAAADAGEVDLGHAGDVGLLNGGVHLDLAKVGVPPVLVVRQHGNLHEERAHRVACRISSCNVDPAGGLVQVNSLQLLQVVKAAAHAYRDPAQTTRGRGAVSASNKRKINETKLRTSVFLSVCSCPPLHFSHTTLSSFPYLKTHHSCKTKQTVSTQSFLGSCMHGLTTPSIKVQSSSTALFRITTNANFDKVPIH